MKRNRGILILAILLLIQVFYMAEFPIVSEPIGNGKVYAAFDFSKFTAVTHPRETDIREAQREEQLRLHEEARKKKENELKKKQEIDAKLKKYENNACVALAVLALGLFLANKYLEKYSDYDEEATMASVFSKKGLLSRHGRRNRKPYTGVSIVLNLIIGALGVFMKAGIEKGNNGLMVFMSILLLCLLYLMFVNVSKRLQDMGVPGLFGILFVGIVLASGLIGQGIFPIISFFVTIYLYVKRGNIGGNLYGPDKLLSQSSSGESSVDEAEKYKANDSTSPDIVSAKASPEKTIVDEGEKFEANGSGEAEIKPNNDASAAFVNNPSLQADAILKYKKLLDMGAITPEEYEEKKKQILNL